MKRVNLHTHNFSDPENIQIRNIFAQDFKQEVHEKPYSVGIHPWHVGQVDLEKSYRNIELAALNKHMLAVGECGLDRAVDIDFELQQTCFKEQIRLAELHRKPLIIHCVRAYSDIIQIKKHSRNSVAWILHGYLGNLQTTLNLVRHGFYFSLGENIVKNTRYHDSLMAIPHDRIFLETDESSIAIYTLYQIFSEAIQIDEAELSATVLRNFEAVFGQVR